MDTLYSFLFDFYLNLHDFIENMFNTSLYFVLGGRLLYIMTYIIFISSLSKNIKLDFLKNSEGINWYKFVLKEFIIIGFGLIHPYFAVFVLAYSILIVGYMRKEIGKLKSQKLMIYFGNFLNPITPILTLLTLFILQFGFHNRLSGEIISVAIACILYGIKSLNLPIIPNLVSFFSIERTAIWHRMRISLKVGVIILAMIIPFAAYGLFYMKVFGGTMTMMVPMRDGFNLKTYIFFPPNWDRTPRGVILSRTPYDAAADNIIQGYAGTYTQKGYIVVLQDQRGRYGSEGIFPVFNSDNTDGIDTINWIMTQSWCNQSIATIGGSAVCTNQYFYHAENVTGMKAANLLCGASELYDIWFYPGGCYKNNIASWWLPAVTTQDQINELISHPTKDSYWANTSLIMNNRVEKINVRAVHVGGWYDVFAQGTVTGFEYYNYYGTLYAKDHQILVMGPWGHGPNSVHPDITYPDLDGWRLQQQAEDFIFAEAFSGIEADWSTQPRVYYYMMGDPDATNSTITFNHWRTAMDWPLTNTSYQAWYLHPNGTLSPNIPSSNSSKSYLYDPTNPVETRGGTTLFIDRENTACDQRPVEANRTDILSFTTPILTSPIEIAGRINATLLIKSNCTDTDFTVKLMDVFPDGREMWLASGILKTRYRNGFTPDVVENMTAGTSYELNIDMWSTAYHFSPDHRIKISITSSNYPAFAVNPNTGGPVLTSFTTYNIANNTVVCGDSTTLSALWLPILPLS